MGRKTFHVRDINAEIVAVVQEKIVDTSVVESKISINALFSGYTLFAFLHYARKVFKAIRNEKLLCHVIIFQRRKYP